MVFFNLWETLPPTAIIHSMAFGLAQKEEITRISVLEITEPASLNDLRLPQPKGLYDPRLGPLDNLET